MHSIIVFLIIFFLEQGEGTIYKCDTNALCGCSSSSTILTRIIGGENALERSWSWSISLRNDGSHICGGSILSSTFIITAAHCIPYLTRLSTVTILAGSLTLNSSLSNKNSQIRSISQIYEHPNYNSMTSENDLALLRLSIPLNLTNGYIKPICLPNGTLSQPANDIDMIAVGWGVTTLSEYTPSLDLRQVTLKSLRSTSNDCQKVIVNSQLQFCAGIPAGGKDTCQGDSGGPLMAFINGLWQLHGITSYGYECALPGYPGVYTRVSSYISWINAVMQTSQLTTLVTNKSTTITTTLTTKKPVVTTTTATTTTKKPITSSTITTKKSTTITTTTTKKSPLTTTVIKKTISQNSTRNSVKEIQYEGTSDTTKQNHFAESSLKPSSGGTYSMNQSLFLLSIIAIYFYFF